MPAYMFAFIERRVANEWVLADPLESDPDADTSVLVPKNMAPPWGWDQIIWYYELSGEKGMPGDVSQTLKDYIQTQWPDKLEAMSWMTLAEIERHLPDASTGSYFHFNPAWFAEYAYENDREIRVVFWWD